MKPTSRTLYAVTILALLLIAAAHLLRLNGLEMNDDEVWHVWQTFGTPEQIVAWLPYDWPPLYEFVLGGWRLLVGIHPFALHMLSLLLSLIGTAFAYRAGRIIGGRWAGLLSMLIYGGLPYITFLSGYVRPYALAQPLIPLGFALMLRYFAPESTRRDHFARGVLLTLALAASFYTSLVAPVWIAFLGLYTLVVYPLSRAIRRWIPVALAFGVLTLPILIAWRGAATNRLTGMERPDLLAGFSEMWANYGGEAGGLWLVLLIAGIAAWGVYGLRHAKPLIGLALWGFGGLVAMYGLHPVIGFFRPSYSFWTLTAFALLGGVLLAQLPKIARAGAAVLLAAMVFVPVPMRVEQNYAPPAVTNFTWLQAHARWGDALVLDPGFDCLAPYEIDYYTGAYFPNGLQVTTTVPDARRIWYASNANRQDQAFAAQVETNRAASIFVGPATCLFRLYEAPPDTTGIAFENGMRFHGGEMIEHQLDQAVPVLSQPVAREGETIHVRLWWSVDAPPPGDYSVGVYLFDQSGEMLAQIDSAPQVNPPETSRWQSGAFYIEERALTLPYPLASGTYRVALSVYGWWEDQTRIDAPGLDGDNLLTLFTLSVMAW